MQPGHPSEDPLDASRALRAVDIQDQPSQPGVFNAAPLMDSLHSFADGDWSTERESDT